MLPALFPLIVHFRRRNHRQIPQCMAGRQSMERSRPDFIRSRLVLFSFQPGNRHPSHFSAGILIRIDFASLGVALQYPKRSVFSEQHAVRLDSLLCSALCQQR